MEDEDSQNFIEKQRSVTCVLSKLIFEPLAMTHFPVGAETGSDVDDEDEEEDDGNHPLRHHPRLT